VKLPDLLDMSIVQKLADANHAATGMPIGIIDALDGSIVVGCGWQEICVSFHRADARAMARCRESDEYIKAHLAEGEPCEYRCKNGLRDIGVPIVVAGRHLATLFLGQFFYDGESPDRAFFVQQAREFGFEEASYLAALDKVPVFTRETVKNIVAYDIALGRFIAELAERALAHVRDEQALREADQRKNEFLGVLSHELRNPLAPIRNALYILDRAAPGGEQATRARSVIGRQVDHLTRLVDDLLDVTRISRGKIQLQRRRVDLGELVLRTIEDHRALFADREIALEVHSAPGPAPVDADETRLAQVLGNLLQNSEKFTSRGGRVAVSVEVHAGAVRVAVRDTGIGIAPELLPNVFEPFTQADDTLHRSLGGLGLGLALVKGLVELHGGRVAARSDGAGLGAEIAFELPLLADAAAPRAAEPAASVRAGCRRILVVEDNPDSAETLREVLGLAGHEVECARDGREGVETARAFVPDVVLCDIGLPEMDGYAVARALRADPATAGAMLVALTGYALPDDQRRAAEAGFDRHLAKPVSLDDLDAVLAAAPRLRAPATVS
jgi:signal transduction histidine kinase/CheY-like chemotaxis protein